MSENLPQMYRKDISSDLFVCKHNECKYETNDENDVQNHCRGHDTEDHKHIKTEAMEPLSDANGDQTTDKTPAMKKTGKYVCEWIGCQKQFSYLKCFESHKRNEHSIRDQNITKIREQNPKNDNAWELYVECRPINGTDRLFCKWPDCQFGSNLRVVVKQHIINSHLTQKRIRSRPKIHSDYEYWDKIQFDKKGVRLSDESKDNTSNSTKTYKTFKTSPLKSKPKALTATKPVATLKPKSSPKSMPILTIASTPKSISRPKTVTTPKTGHTLKTVVKPKIVSSPKTVSTPETVSAPKTAPTIITVLSGKSVSNAKTVSTLKAISIPELKFYGKSEPQIESEILAKKHLNIDKNKRDVLLSCKGLASMTRVAQYFNKKVIDGEKIYWCQWNGCQFKTKKSQKIAEHINLSHIGVDFKCNKPNCNKVFKNPHSYREHQKNHICGFGSFGYGSKGVIGVCRNENLFKYRERVIIKGKKYYRCKCCNAITKYFTGMKRHIHSQHICPFRMNLHLTRHQTPMAIKQEIMELDIDFDLFNNQRFICCLKCNQFFDSKEELKNHEMMFCRFRSESINQNMTTEIPNEFSFANVCESNGDFKQSPQKNSNRLKLSEQIRQNVNAINESIAKNLSFTKGFVGHDSNTQESLENYIYLKEFENSVYFMCKYDDGCGFVTKLKDKINEHILDKHLRHESANYGQYPDFDNSEPNSIFEPKIKVEPMDYDENEPMPGLESQPSTSGLQNCSQNNLSIEKYIEIKCIDGDPNYFCVYNTQKCKYYTKEYIDIKSHIKESHVLYECNVEDCGKQFKNLMALSAHKVNHICGFGIKGRKSSGVCGLENIKKYCDEKCVNNRQMFVCKWIDCQFVSKTRNNVLSHSHHKHICPNRMLANTDIKTNTITNGRKTKAFVMRTNSPLLRQSIDESVYESSSSQGSDRHDLEVLGTFGTQESLDNFVKYSDEVMIEDKLVFVCLYPNCSVTPRNRSYSPEITDRYNSYVTDFKHNMIRHIRRHCNDKPFVCGVNGCDKRFSCSSQFKNHQSSHSNTVKVQ